MLFSLRFTLVNTSSALQQVAGYESKSAVCSFPTHVPNIAPQHDPIPDNENPVEGPKVSLNIQYM